MVKLREVSCKRYLLTSSGEGPGENIQYRQEPYYFMNTQISTGREEDRVRNFESHDVEPNTHYGPSRPPVLLSKGEGSGDEKDPRSVSLTFRSSSPRSSILETRDGKGDCS